MEALESVIATPEGDLVRTKKVACFSADGRFYVAWSEKLRPRADLMSKLFVKRGSDGFKEFETQAEAERFFHERVGV